MSSVFPLSSGSGQAESVIAICPGSEKKSMEAGVLVWRRQPIVRKGRYQPAAIAICELFRGASLPVAVRACRGEGHRVGHRARGKRIVPACAWLVGVARTEGRAAAHDQRSRPSPRSQSRLPLKVPTMRTMSCRCFVRCVQVPLATPAVEVALKSPSSLMPSPAFVTVQPNTGAAPAALGWGDRAVLDADHGPVAGPGRAPVRLRYDVAGERTGLSLG